MADDVELANVLLTMQHSIRGDIKDCKTELSAQIADVRETQETHGLRLTALEQQTSGVGLTKAQKTALWGGASALAFEIGKHIKTLFFGLLIFVKGGRV